MIITDSSTNRRTIGVSSEQGAALITALMVAALVLAAGGALILTTGMSTTTSIDATAEMQAYYAAEAGLQQSLNALRGNVSPSGGVAAGTKLTFRNAITRGKTNASTDPTSAPLRLSGWLQYNYTSTGSAFPDRVKVSPTDDTYNPLTGVAFQVVISEVPPDNTCDACGDPARLVIQSIGYGPKGATKRLEMVVHRNYFSFAPPAAITMAGGTTMTFNMGSSNASGYTGNDIHDPPLASIPAVAVTSGSNQTTAQGVIDYLNAQGGGTQVTPSTAELLTSSTTPDFLQSADAARAFLATAAEIAQGDGRYFGTQAAVTGGLGTSTAPRTTFIDNYGGAAVSLGAGYQGCGLLIVTGELITSGNTDFEGMILVLGSGTFNRNGNGNGHIDGGIIVAKFDPYGTGDFGAPTFSVNGAGNSDVRYNSDAIRKAFDSAGVFVAGIHEF
jgi:hypothetical protein